mmetsp:Transcript_106179/g.317194  ORF Transcript_106179/g.317194 Transcript_106179/m.317194 type:complete len:206 (-) Transcript_106179:338-955(-)
MAERQQVSLRRRVPSEPKYRNQPAVTYAGHTTEAINFTSADMRTTRMTTHTPRATKTSQATRTRGNQYHQKHDPLSTSSLLSEELPERSRPLMSSSHALPARHQAWQNPDMTSTGIFRIVIENVRSPTVQRHKMPINSPSNICMQVMSLTLGSSSRCCSMNSFFATRDRCQRKATANIGPRVARATPRTPSTSQIARRETAVRTG